MIMYTLHPSQHFTPELVDWYEALECIQAMADDGASVEATDFHTPNGEHVTVFWSVDANGTVATVWEYTMSGLFFPATTPVSVREVMRTEYAMQDMAASARRGMGESYSRGE